MSNNFADRLVEAIKISDSVLLAGCDPVIESLPPFILEEATRTTTTDSAFFQKCLDIFTDIFCASVAGKVCAVKPNLGFFEQFGLAGVTAFSRFCEVAKQNKLLVIADAKRGDIGSTAKAYSGAFIAKRSVVGRQVTGFECDAVTVNPFLGFDTLEPFISDAKEFGTGIFILLKTSNPGSADIQGQKVSAEGTVSDHIAEWLNTRGQDLIGQSGLSSLGAVVGATYPAEARELRQKLPHTFFLIPGYGAQGGSASDAVAGFTQTANPSGGIVNASRALLSGNSSNADELISLIRENAGSLSKNLNNALAT